MSINALSNKLLNVLNFVSVGRKKHFNIKSSRLLENALLVRKGVKACFAMVGYNAAVSNTSKRDMGIKYMGNSIVYTAATKLKTLMNPILNRRILSKKIQCQGFRFRANFINYSI